MSRTTDHEGKVANSKKNLQRGHSGTRPTVIEGEASETDDEQGPSTSASPVPQNPVEEIVIPCRARVHVDEKLAQRWHKLGEDALLASVRRSQPAQKTANDIEICVDKSIVTVQVLFSPLILIGKMNASSHTRHTAAVVCQLADSVDALIGAAKLIPSKFDNTVNVMRVI
ncbi:unnamed protein product [Nippostrongylus brasiliensis]|uniref:Uncharacterized protein n=1 Tax=Nippostrongylus brasiliensis TaxID=27835 RepID=A0A0N4Y2C3_NIPBR|nr:unnamed protein product [Nippostrongylus brasiliensis]